MGFGPTTIDIFEEKRTLCQDRLGTNIGGKTQQKNAIVCEQEGLSERGPAAAPPR
jgi:hypothetical protein|eukprot:COSAG06_NODE_4055_length_4619_cov_64.502434_5_plen_55_part_00